MIEKLQEEKKFIFKVIRNAFILSGMYFVSVWATTQELNFLLHIKPVLIFLFTYIFTECIKRYNLTPKSESNINTYIF